MTAPGPALSRRALLVGAAMASTAAGAYAAMPRQAANRLQKSQLAAMIPKQVAAWQYVSDAGVVTTSEAARSDGYDQVLTRVYAAPDLPRIMLLIAYGSTQGGSLQLHRPETCYPGQGFQLSAFREIDLGPARQIAVRAFTAKRDDRIERVLYWTRIGTTFPRSQAELYRAIFTSVLSGTVPDGVLVRVSTLTDDAALADGASSDAALASFCAAMIASGSEKAQNLLIGAPLPLARAQAASAGDLGDG